METQRESNESPRERARAARVKVGPKPKTASAPKPSPTRPIEPGTVHYHVAEMLLKQAQARAASKGIALDIGEMVTGSGAASPSDDPQTLVKTVGHAVARVGDKFGPLRKLSRHLEGRERRAGLLADIAAAVAELYRRNPDEVKMLAESFLTDVRRKQEARQSAVKASQNGHMPQTPAGV